ncbi:MAG: hypothetical protein ACYTF9_03450 [Planctomycetota bacterium]|jgi:hypothetical protein
MSTEHGLWIDLADETRRYRPGQRIEGVAAWSLEEAPPAMHLSLIWFTSGKGDRDLGLRELITYESVLANDSHTFSITVPDGPTSFSGRLLSIAWVLELAIGRTGLLPRSMECTRVPITVGPGGREIVAER